MSIEKLPKKKDILNGKKSTSLHVLFANESGLLKTVR